MKLVADENIVGLDRLPDTVEVRTSAGRQIDRTMLRDADALWVRSVTRVTDELVRDAPLRFVGSATAGLEHVDREALAARGIAFAAAPGANAMAVVEYVLAALLRLRDPWEALCSGATLGIVGYGNVGRRLAAFAGAMEWRTRVFDPLEPALAQLACAATLDEVLACDVITLHCALHDDPPWPSRHLIDAAALDALRPGAWLINASRGAVVDNRALLDYLSRGKPAGVVLDVWEGEPEILWPLLEQPALRLATPHIAGYSWDAKWAATRMLAEATAAVGLLEGGLGAPGVPAPALPDVRPEEGNAGTLADAPAALLEACYDIGADDAALRKTARMEVAARDAAFDALRRDYPLRRELSALIGGVQAAGESGHTTHTDVFCSALRAAIDAAVPKPSRPGPPV